MKKRILLLLLLVVGVLTLTGCGKENEKEEKVSKSKKEYSIGDMVKTNNYKITLKDAELTHSILVYKGQDMMKNAFKNFEDFFSPTDEPFTDENGYVLEGIHGFTASKDYVFLYYNIEFEYIGKKEETLADLQFVPKVIYNEDYKFESNYFSFYRTNNKGEKSEWSNFNGDEVSLVRSLGLEIGYFNGKIESLSEEIYEIRGVIRLPNKVYEDKNGTIEFAVAGESFEVR